MKEGMTVSSPQTPDSGKRPASDKKKSRLGTFARALLYGGKGWKQFFVYMAAWFAIWPATGALFFPRAETVLAEQGMNPKIAAELAPGKKIYVRTDNMLGKAHALLDLGPLGAPLTWYNALRKGSEGGHARSGANGPNAAGICEVYMHTSEYRNVPPEQYQQALLHEIRHCSSDNMHLLTGYVLDTVQAEGDAEARAAQALAREKHRPEMVREALMERARNGSPGDWRHDSALVLDAIFNGRALPANADINAANREAAATYEQITHSVIITKLDAEGRRALGQGVCDEAEFKPACHYDPAAQGMSPLALRRAELFRDAMRESIKLTVTPGDASKAGKPATSKKTPSA